MITDGKIITILDDILKNVKNIVDKREEDDGENEVLNEWKEVASVVDRFLFIIFFIITAITTSVLLVFIPIWRHYVDNAELKITP